MDSLISRQAVIDALKDWYDGMIIISSFRGVEKVIKALPSAQPERPEQPESAREYCAECDHIEMCRWYPYEGCEFRSLPSVQPEQRWVPCSERLSEEGQIVLATHLGGLDPNRQVIEHIYSGGKFLLNWEMDMEMLSPTFGQRYMGDVIAWMPLPEPYKDGDKE